MRVILDIQASAGVSSDLDRIVVSGGALARALLLSRP